MSDTTLLQSKEALEPISAFAPWGGRAPFHAGCWSLDASFRFCMNLALSHYENFPVFLRVFDKEQRDALAAVYAFARIADDFADEREFRGVGEALLDRWRRQLDRCGDQGTAHPVFVALSWAMARFSIEPRLLHDLLDAFMQDCRTTRYETFGDLLNYCQRSANPVGRIVLRILDDDDDDNRRWSDQICTALQLTNFWQDVSVDAKKNRLYLPLEDLEHYKVKDSAIFGGVVSEPVHSLILFEAQRTRELFRSGRNLILNAAYPGSLYFAGVWLGGRTVLRMVKDLGARVVRERPVLGKRRIAHAWLSAGLTRLTGREERSRWIH
ncbi:MAG: squalene synthase HpnC [Myxococcales bacterium]|nr:MAG: squalene synthase HpnC [Myxococcales bacterium]